MDAFTQLRFLLSEDEEFLPIGKSKINYLKDFFTYRSMLHELKGTTYIDGLYAFYNKRVFAGMPTVSSSDTGSGEDYAGSVAEALLAMRLADTTSKFLINF